MPAASDTTHEVILPIKFIRRPAVARRTPRELRGGRWQTTGWQRGDVILAVDEKPNLQVLERAAPKQPLRPGQIERQEFDYHRHGTINLLAGLTVYTGHRWAECLDKNDGEHFRPVMRRLLHPYSWANRIHLIMDNGTSHIRGDTTEFFHDLSPRVQVLWTPVNASWLNQAEALLEGFGER